MAVLILGAFLALVLVVLVLARALPSYLAMRWFRQQGTRNRPFCDRTGF